jgi:hypothetical protein
VFPRLSEQIGTQLTEQGTTEQEILDDSLPGAVVADSFSGATIPSEIAVSTSPCAWGVLCTSRGLTTGPSALAMRRPPDRHPAC